MWYGKGSPAGQTGAGIPPETVIAKADAPALSDRMRRFVDWVAAYTMTPPGSVLRMVLNTPAALEPAPAKQMYVKGGPEPERMTPGRAQVLKRPP